jgi:hypothetical protein
MGENDLGNIKQVQLQQLELKKAYNQTAETANKDMGPDVSHCVDCFTRVIVV